MQTYDRFIFDSYRFEPVTRTITLTYSLDDKITFQETITLPPDIELHAGHPDLNAAMFALHLSGGASYYKTYLPKTIEIRSGQLDAAQAAFWNNLYTYGLGEFFYQNHVDFRGLINFPVTKTHTTPPPKAAPATTPARVLVPFGGGKDSIVTTEILRAAGLDQTLFRLRPHRLITELSDTAGLPLLQAGRTLAPELLRLQNEAGALQGHVPITAHISFLTIIISLMAGFDAVFFSNERSSSYGNVEYLGIQVNHQWSKSLEFETALRDYLGAYVTTDVAYLNAVRPLSELHIARIFTQFPQYFNRATSCNRNWTQAERSPDAPIWCGTCPKCAFSFALLAAFLPAETVITIFGHNLYEDESLIPLYRELWGVAGFKPFECVGTPEEAQAATYLARTKPGFADAAVMREFRQHVLPGFTDPETHIKTLLTPQFQLSPTEITSILTKSHLL
jgi:hypothetical protein